MVPYDAVSQVRERVQTARARGMQQVETARSRVMAERQRLMGKGLGLGVLGGGNPHPTVASKVRERVQRATTRIRRREFLPAMGGCLGCGETGPAVTPTAGALKPAMRAGPGTTLPAIGGNTKKVRGVTTMPAVGGG